MVVGVQHVGMAKECKSEDCERATQNGDDYCPLCQYNQKEDDEKDQFNALKDRL